MALYTSFQFCLLIAINASKCFSYHLRWRNKVLPFPSTVMTSSTSFGENSGLATPSKRPRADEIVTDDDINQYNREILKCDVCQGVYLSQEKFNNHMKIHRLQRDYHCRTCGSSYTSKKGLALHQRSAHTEPRQRQPIQRGGGGSLPEVPRQVNF